MKKCNKCGEIKPLNEFHKNSARKDGLQTQCKNCHAISRANTYQKHKQRHSQFMAIYYASKKSEYRKRDSQRRAAFKQAVPTWYEEEQIKSVYQKADEYGLTVDHVVPLQSKKVCGLHCWANLQLLDKHLNSAKKNSFWPDMWEDYGSETP